MKEIELAAKVVEWLKQNNWDVYQEVSIGYASKRADIVAVRDKLTWIIECKTSLGIAVLDQAYYWICRGMAHFVSVAVPSPIHRRRETISPLVIKFLNDYGIGIIFARSRTREYIRPGFVRQRRLNHRVGGIEQFLHEEQKQIGTAGSANGNYYTPYRSTIEKVKEVLRVRGPLPIDEIIRVVSTHYSTSSERASLQAALTNYESDWCGIDNSQKPYKYFLRNKTIEEEK